jgi:hypothetical protein
MFVIKIGYRSKIIFCCTLVLATAVGGTAYLCSRIPIYNDSHTHDDAFTHSHVHTHGEGINHGHWHFGFTSLSHSHSHHHGHLHDSQELPDNHDSMIELGHVHRTDGMYVYWATCQRNEHKLSLRFFGGIGKQVSVIRPDNMWIRGHLYRNNEILAEIEFVQSNGMLDGDIPETVAVDSLILLSVTKIKFDGESFDLKAVIDP